MNLLTEFGKFSRKLRIDRGEFLKDMADILNVTSSYLSAVEVGKRNVPEEWKEKIASAYNLSKLDELELMKAIDNSQLNLKLNLNDFSNDFKDVVFSFARNFNELNNDDKESIRKILRKTSR